MDIIPRIASLLGIDPAREPQFLWIAEHAAGTIVDPDEWAEFTTSKGQVLYYNKKSKVCAFDMKVLEFRKYNLYIRL
jgi:hypothetical protein